MRYAEKVMLHQMVQQTFTERKAYDAFSDRADRRLWFMKKSQILGGLSDIIERYEFENQVIRKIADRERSELASKKDLNEDSSRLYNSQIELLEEVVEIKMLMTKTLKSMRHSVTILTRYSSKDVNMMTSLAEKLISKLRDLSDISGLLEKYDKPFYSNNRKFQ